LTVSEIGVKEICFPHFALYSSFLAAGFWWMLDATMLFANEMQDDNGAIVRFTIA
jgi:hypothetical protein